MSSLFKKYLNNYIKTVIKKGLNLQKGQRLLITSPFSPGVHIELAPLVELLSKEAYINRMIEASAIAALYVCRQSCQIPHTITINNPNEAR